MTKRLGIAALTLMTLAGTTALVAAGRQASTASDLVVHEWGTFTSVAGPAGQAVEWAPLNGPSELPCFVRILNPISVKTMIADTVVTATTSGDSWLSTLRATVRMETPVLYFYTSRDTNVNVRVRFPQGLITEWYPQARVPAVGPYVKLANTTGGIEWSGVRVSPAFSTNFPVEPGSSHYYTARATDGVPVQVDGQNEKFLFYRGLASFPVSLSATVNATGKIVVGNTGAHGIRTGILFHSDGRRLGYRIVTDLAAQATIDPPALDGTADGLRKDLERILVEQGLYPREAAAMVATWRDSWFEAGTRLMYFLPQSAVDAILPLQIEPAPVKTARVFVGRLEIITPETQATVERAVRTGDFPALMKVARFLEPIAASLAGRFASSEDRTKLQSALRTVASWYASAEGGCRY